MTAYGPAADVDDGRGERLVHRHRALPEPGDAGPVAERLGERGAEDERDVLDGVVLVDLEVAVGVDGEVEQAVVGERAEEVVEEPDARVDAGVARAVEAERDGDLGLVGRPGDASRDGPRAGRSRCRRGAWSCRGLLSMVGRRAAMSRSFSSGSRTVRRRWSASGWPAPNVRGTRPRDRRPSATAAARSTLPKSTRMKFVTDGPTDQPAARSASVRRARSRDDAREVGVEDRRVAQRLGDERDRHGRDGAGRPERVEPGDDLGTGDGESDPEAGQGVGLAGGPDRDEVRVVRRAGRPATCPTNSA